MCRSRAATHSTAPLRFWVAAHQFREGGEDILVIKKHIMHGLGDRHLDLVAAGQFANGTCGGHAFGNLR